MTIRRAEPDEAPALANLINAAFVVEAFFKVGNRTHAEEVAALMAFVVASHLLLEST